MRIPVFDTVSSTYTDATRRKTHQALQLLSKCKILALRFLDNAQYKYAPKVTNPGEDLQRRPQGSFLGMFFKLFSSAMVVLSVETLRGRVQSCVVERLQLLKES